MAFNTTGVAGGSDTSLSTIATSRDLAGAHDVNFSNNLGYGLGKIARNAIDQLYKAWQRLLVSKLSIEEIASRKHMKIYRHGLRECLQKLDTALDNLRNNPYDSRIKRREWLCRSWHCSSWLFKHFRQHSPRLEWR